MFNSMIDMRYPKKDFDSPADEELAKKLCEFIPDNEHCTIQLGYKVRNYKKKIEEGIYDHDLAIKGLLNYAMEAYKEYKKTNIRQQKYLNEKTKTLIAEMLLEHIE